MLRSADALVPLRKEYFALLVRLYRSCHSRALIRSLLPSLPPGHRPINADTREKRMPNAKRVLPWQRHHPAWSLAPALVCTRPSGFLIIIILLHKNPGYRPNTPPSNHHHLLSFDFAPESQAELHHSSLLSDAPQLPLTHSDRKDPPYIISFDTSTEGKGCLR